MAKRKASEDLQTHNLFPLDDLHEDLLERVLARLPPASFFRLRSICRRFNSLSSSPTFHIACSQIAYREPWFLMVDQELGAADVIFDISEGSWRSLNPRSSLKKEVIPVASSGGLVCYKTETGDLIVSNPLTGVYRELPSVTQVEKTETLHAISMHCTKEYPCVYKIILVFGELSHLSFLVFDSSKNKWEEEVKLVKKTESSSEDEINEEEVVYFLSKTGDVVSTNMQRSPSKQYSSVLVNENGEEMLYFLSHSGTIISCNLVQKTFFELPRILPVYFEYSIDLIESNGEMLVVVLSEFFESASLRFWRYCKREKAWVQAAFMPPSVSHQFYGKKMDVNCVGHGDLIFLCASSSEFSSAFKCDLKGNEWMELPKCFVNSKPKEFLSAFSFEPRLEALV
ncbi:hypothetical protein LUZ60_006575 [Juncus effusus]|nr:hypothetical protein LUZ60_006575 [Juncus effusus]